MHPPSSFRCVFRVGGSDSSIHSVFGLVNPARRALSSQAATQGEPGYEIFAEPKFIPAPCPSAHLRQSCISPSWRHATQSEGHFSIVPMGVLWN